MHRCMSSEGIGDGNVVNNRPTVFATKQFLHSLHDKHILFIDPITELTIMKTIILIIVQ